MEKLIFGLDIGGTKCAVSLGRITTDRNGYEAVEFLAKQKFLTNRRNPEAILEEFSECIQAIMLSNHVAAADVFGIGISCGGPLDSRNGVILSPPNLAGWDSVEIVSYFEKKTGIHTKLQNDANACAIAEWRFGAGKGTENMVFLTFGTGLGAGLILNGKLYSGSSDMAGEVGHLRLAQDGPVGYDKKGSAEGFCSGGGLAQIGICEVEKELKQGNVPRLLQKAGTVENITAKLIGDLAEKERDELCINIYRQCGFYLGHTLSILVDLLNPEKIILGGIFMRSSELIKPAMEQVLKQECLARSLNVCQIVPAGLGEMVGDYAAIAVAATENV